MREVASTTLAVVRRVLVRILLLPVLLWRATVVLRQPRCRFAPSCSTYAVTALRVHGPLRGAWLAVRRVLRCHPWNPGGIDHVPPARRGSTATISATTTVPSATSRHRHRHDRNAA